MSDDFDLDGPAGLTERLRALGSQPVDPGLASQHLTALAGVSRPRGVLRQRVAVAGALLAGLLAGGTGLGVAGALGPAQPVFDRAARAVGVETPPGHDRYDGPECVGEPARNRGQYLKQERAKGEAAFEAAKATDCGKPRRAVTEAGDDAGEEAPKATETPTEPQADKGDRADRPDKADKADKPGKAGDTVEERGRPDGPGRAACADRGQGDEELPGSWGRKRGFSEPGPDQPGRPDRPDATGKPSDCPEANRK